MYCLVVIDDYGRFSWVFFLATKDETNGILKAFITGIENLIDHKVKIIRCDNETEFKNKEMNQFCKMKANQTNGIAGTKANIDAGQAEKKTVFGPQYALLPLLTSDSQGPKSSEDEVADDARKKSTEVLRNENQV
nr:putative ribonuclease H-like domain-containing protein [Tanacetum cinerariifolium]